MPDQPRTYTERDIEGERQTGYWIAVIDNLEENMRLQHGQPTVDLSLYAWDVQAIRTALVRLSLDLRSGQHPAHTTSALTDGLARDHQREVRVGNLPDLGGSDA